MKKVSAKFDAIFKTLNDANIVTTTYDSIFINLDIPNLQMLYLPCIAYFKSIIYDKKYKLYYMQEPVGYIKFIKDVNTMMHVKVRVLLDPSSKYFNELHSALQQSPACKTELLVTEKVDENI